ncbi:hypothetical protein Cni_G06990 [Canna indica]|uniref:Uncharacterized protein n=1 Tax=Canna indica TaxID=4628 RepID=A0AAQ3Q4I2_9LILI|nr:hypothetical protein Cni_G06990 [Canna indica]
MLSLSVFLHIVIYLHFRFNLFRSRSTSSSSSAMGFDAGTTPPSSPSSLKRRLRSSLCFSCCFRSAAVDAASPEERPPAASLIRSSAVWLRAKAQELPDIGGRYCGMMARTRRHHGRRHSGGDFRYDPLSYALNFDEGPDGDGHDAALATGEQPFRCRSFSSRLAQPSPTGSRVRSEF